MKSEGVRPVTILYLVLSFLLMGVSGSILSPWQLKNNVVFAFRFPAQYLKRLSVLSCFV
jgi:hypothetical protein